MISDEHAKYCIPVMAIPAHPSPPPRSANTIAGVRERAGKMPACAPVQWTCGTLAPYGCAVGSALEVKATAIHTRSQLAEHRSRWSGRIQVMQAGGAPMCLHACATHAPGYMQQEAHAGQWSTPTMTAHAKTTEATIVPTKSREDV